jgi:hypothetical protein
VHICIGNLPNQAAPTMQREGGQTGDGAMTGAILKQVYGRNRFVVAEALSEGDGD